MIYSISIRGVVDRVTWSDTILFEKNVSLFTSPETFSITYTALSFSSLITLSYHSYLMYFYLLCCSHLAIYILLILGGSLQVSDLLSFTSLYADREHCYFANSGVL